MMTEQLGFSVLSAPLAALDRRALSQAWYSALHLTSGRAREKNLPAPSGVGASSTVRATKAEPGAKPPAHTSTSPFGVQRRGGSERVMSAEGDRRLRSPLARKIESVFLHPSKPLQRATFSVGGASRVHISLQNSGFGIRLVAVCAPAHRAAVAKALEEARYALAARGICVGVAVGAGCDAD